MELERRSRRIANGRFSEFQRATEVSADVRPAPGTLAAITGGRLIFNSNDFSEGIRRAANEVDGAHRGVPRPPTGVFSG